MKTAWFLAIVLVGCSGDVCDGECDGADDSQDLTGRSRIGVVDPAVSPYGVVGSPRGLPGAFPLARQAGLGWVMIYLEWDRLEPAEGQYVFDQPTLGPPGWPLESADSLIDAAKAAGFEVLVAVWGTPRWAGATPMTPPRTPQQFGNFVRAVAARYGDRVAAWELWCEPNLPQFWRGTPAQYRGLVLGPGFDALKSVRPAAKVVGPAIDYGADAVTLAPYLLEPSGAPTRPIDVLSIHSFEPPAQTIAHLANASHFATQHQIPEVWLTSFGWAASSGCYSYSSTPGLFTTHVLNQAESAGLPLVKRAFVFNLHDRSAAFAEHSCAFGLLDRNGNPKKSYGTVKRWITGL